MLAPLLCAAVLSLGHGPLDHAVDDARPVRAAEDEAASPADTAGATKPVAPPPSAKVRPAGQAYSIGPGDVLRIVVYGQDALTQSVIVQPDGAFTFPLIGRVQAADMTPAELQRQLVVLLAKDFIRNPQVTVDVQEYRSRTVFVVGEIAKPGAYALEGETTVIRILARAGPTTANAGSEVVIVRPAERDVHGPVLPSEVGAKVGQATVLRVNLRDIEAGILDKNVVLQPNDTVFVPQAPTVFVTGEVRNPGGYSFRPGATVRQVISLAGGFTERSSNRIRVVREEEGKSVETKIQLDDPVRPGDIVIVKARLF